ncbi:MAG: UDP-3-O-acyl-N-acetylglucosamine deacetylase [Planctomycetes bacterium]|nr:UDP-3-O-acyl-N-acetylglucosamine deacetylase [Planctomycetota bacterium]
MKQTTLAKAVSLTGISLHEGLDVTLVIKPAVANTGYKFIRTDRDNAEVRACTENITEVQRRTLLVQNGIEVHTCEHILAALYGLGVDNAEIELSAAEPPAGDGSARVFVEMIQQAGITELDTEAKVFSLADSFEIESNGASIKVEPSGTFSLEYTLDYSAAFMPSATVSFDLTPETFINQIAPARTFCLEEEAKQLQAMGFGKGANTQNTLVVSPDGPLENALRFDDEYARHKLLDIVGDLALVGVRLTAKVTAVKSGHSLNQQAAIEIRKQIER